MMEFQYSSTIEDGWLISIAENLCNNEKSISSCLNSFIQQMVSLLQPNVWTGEKGIQNYQCFMETYDFFAEFLTKFYAYFNRVIKIFAMYPEAENSQVYIVSDFPTISKEQIEALVDANVKNSQIVINYEILSSVSENLERIKIILNNIFVELIEKVNIINKGIGILDDAYYNQLKNELKTILFEGCDNITNGLEKCILNINNVIHDSKFITSSPQDAILDVRK